MTNTAIAAPLSTNHPHNLWAFEMAEPLIATTIRLSQEHLDKIASLDFGGTGVIDRGTRIRRILIAYFDAHPLISILGEEMPPRSPGFIFAMAKEDSHLGRLIQKFIALWLSNGFKTWEETLYQLYLALESDCLSRGMDLNLSPDKDDPRSLYIAIEKAIDLFNTPEENP